MSTYGSGTYGSGTYANAGGGGGTDITQSAPVADISVAGLDATITIVPDAVDVTVSVPVANTISVAANAASVTIDDQETAEIPNISIAGLEATVTTSGAVTVAADLAGISVAGLDATVDATTPDLTVSAPAANITVAGLAADVHVPFGAEIAAPLADIFVAGQAPTITIAAAQFLRPDSNVITPQSGGFADIDETTANDMDVVYFTPSKTLLAVGLSNPAGVPNLRDNHIVRVRWQSIGASTMSLELRTTGMPNNINNVLSPTFPTQVGMGVVEWRLTYDQVKQIQEQAVWGAYNSLQLWIRVTGGSGGYVSWVQMEIPEAGGAYLYIDTDPVSINVAGVPPEFTGQVVTDTGVLANTASTIAVAGQPASISSGQETFISVSPAAITVAAPAPNLAAGGVTEIGVDSGDMIVAGVNAATSTDRMILFQADVVDVGVSSGGADVRIGPDHLSFRFIEDTYTGLSTQDALALQDLTFGPLLHGQSKTLRFRIGNSSTVATHFLIYARSTNPGIAPMVQFSRDNYTYVNVLPLGSILPNAVSDVVWMKITVAPDAYIGEGSFLVEVMQDVA